MSTFTRIFLAQYADVHLWCVVQIRDFEYSPEGQESRKQELEKLMQDQECLRSSLLQWCYTSYGEVSSFLCTWYGSEDPVTKLI